jgi:hypothetical protein
MAPQQGHCGGNNASRKTVPAWLSWRPILAIGISTIAL